MRSGGRGAAALAWGASMSTSATTTTHVADRELDQLLELLQLLDRGGVEPQRLASALRHSRAAARLFASDTTGFKAALGLVARQLWPAGDLPLGLSWALQAVGVEVPRPDVGGPSS